MTPDLSSITLAIIAGGAGSRMGGPKHQLTIDAQPILTALLDHLNWPGPTLLVTAHDRPLIAGQERCTTIAADPIPNQGPLRGILTAREASSTETLVAVPIDMPELRREHLAWLDHAALSHPDASCILTRDSRGQLQPFPAILRLAIAPDIRAMLNSGRRALHSLAALPSTRAIAVPWHPHTWSNLNTPQDLIEYSAQVRPSSSVSLYVTRQAYRPLGPSPECVGRGGGTRPAA